MKKLIISYQKYLSDNGVVYTQTVKAPIELLAEINKALAEAKARQTHKALNGKMNAIYISELQGETENLTKLTTARIVKSELADKGYNVTRFKDDRNTRVLFY